MPRKSVHGRRSITQGEPTVKVRRNTLLLIAALVWSAAGFNILRIGLLACPPYRTIVNYLLSAVVYRILRADCHCIL